MDSAEKELNSLVEQEVSPEVFTPTIESGFEEEVGDEPINSLRISDNNEQWADAGFIEENWSPSADSHESPPKARNEGGERESDDEEEKEPDDVEEFGMDDKKPWLSEVQETATIDDFETQKRIGQGAYG